MRLIFLDSIRGIASFCVLLSHIFACFLFAQTPLLAKISSRLVFFDGQFAVNVFFVLSGMCLSIAYLSPPPPATDIDMDNASFRQIKSMIAQRYFRLALPIAMTSAGIAVMLNMKLMTNNEIDNMFSNEWIKLFYHHAEKVSFKEWFDFSFYDALLLHGRDSFWLNNSLNPVLWTMPIEFKGSALVFLLIIILKANPGRWVAYFLLSLYFYIFKSYMLHFILGIIISEMYALYAHKYINFKKRTNYISLFVIILILIHVSVQRPSDIRLRGLLAFSLILLCSSNSLVINFLQRPAFLFLGKICFTLYLAHLPIIASLGPVLTTYLEYAPAYVNVFITGSALLFVSVSIAFVLMFGENRLMRTYKTLLHKHCNL